MPKNTDTIQLDNQEIPLPELADKEEWTKTQQAQYIAQVAANTNRWATIREDQDLLFCGHNNEWNTHGEQYLRQYVDRTLGLHASKRIRREVIDAIQSRNYISITDLGPNPYQLPLKNGILDLKQKELRDLEPLDYIKHPSPVTYNPGAEAPEFHEFIQDTVPSDEQRNKLQEFAGLTLHHWGYPIKKLLVLLGPKNSGKSTYLNILSELYPEQKRSSTTLHDLAHSEFERSNLHRKTVNICPELDADAVQNTGFIKQAVGRDQITAQRKYRTSIDFRNSAKLLFSANRMPPIKQQDEAFQDRLEIVEFPKSIPAEEQDHGLERRIIEEELSGVLNWAIEGYKRLEQNNWKLSNPLDVDETRRLSLKWGDNMHRFVFSTLTFENDALAPVEEVYQRYEDFCNELGEPTESKKALSEALHQLGVSTTRRRFDGERQYCYKGVELEPLEWVRDLGETEFSGGEA